MAVYKYADRVAESTVTVGTGDIALAGAIDTDHATFGSQFADLDTPIPCVVFGGGKWMTFDARYNLGANSLTRMTFRDSSTGSNLSLSGTMTVMSCWDAKRAILTLLSENNLSDLASAATSRTNLGVNFYDAAMGLTAVQQLQHRANIYAAPIDALSENTLIFNGGSECRQDGPSGMVALTSGTEKYLADGITAKFVRSATLAISAGLLDGPSVGSMPPGCLLAAVMQSTTGLGSLAAGDYAYFSYPIQGYTVSKLDLGKSTATFITFGIWLFSSAVTGTVTIALQNSAGNRTLPTSVVINAASVWEYKVVTVQLDTSGTWLYTVGLGLRAIVCFASGSTNQGTVNTWNADGKFATSAQTNFFASTSNYVGITGAFAVPGKDAPTSADAAKLLRPLHRVLRDARNLYEQSYDYGVAPGTVDNNGALEFIVDQLTAASRTISLVTRFVVPKLATPNVTIYSPVTGASGNARNLQTAADVAVTNSNIGFNGCRSRFTSGSEAAISAQWHYVAEKRL